MGTSTAKLKLYRPAITGEAVRVQDLNDNMDKLEALLPYTICTSGARPASPFQGQTIYETDTKLTYFWDGSRWTKQLSDYINGGDLTYPGTKNGLHNGEFRVSQRGTSGLHSVDAGTGRTGFDRWTVYRTSFATGVSWSQQLTGGLSATDKTQYCARVQRVAANAATTVCSMTQALESLDSYRFAGKKVTLSFWARKGANYSAASSLLTAEVGSGTGTDESGPSAFTGAASVLSQTPTLTTSWQKFTYTSSAVVSVSATQLKVNFSFTPVGTAGANDYFEVTNVQLEEGESTTAFERVPYAWELNRCMRFFQRFTGDGSGAEPIATGMCLSSTQSVVLYSPKVPLRTQAPSINWSAPGDFTVANASGVATAVTSLGIGLSVRNASFRINANVASGLVAGNATYLAVAAGSSGVFLDIYSEI